MLERSTSELATEGIDPNAVVKASSSSKLILHAMSASSMKRNCSEMAGEKHFSDDPGEVGGGVCGGCGVCVVFGFFFTGVCGGSLGAALASAAFLEKNWDRGAMGTRSRAVRLRFGIAPRGMIATDATKNRGGTR